MPRLVPRILAASAALLLAAACTTTGEAPPAATPVAASVPAPAKALATDDLVGRWGFASYHDDKDRARIEQVAKASCGQPYAILRGPGGGVLIHSGDRPEMIEHVVRGTVVAPAAGGPGDRQVLAYDGRLLVMRYADPMEARRYGTMVYWRCGK